MAGASRDDTSEYAEHYAIVSEVEERLRTELEAALGVCRATDFGGRHGINEAGFKGMVIMALRQIIAAMSDIAVAIESERKFYGDGSDRYADLHVIVRGRGQEFVLILELKYYRAGWYCPTASNFATAREIKDRTALTAVATRWSGLPAERLQTQCFWSPPDHDTAGGSVSIEKQLPAHRRQLREYLTYCARDSHVHPAADGIAAVAVGTTVPIHGMLVIGAVNRVIIETHQLNSDGRRAPEFFATAAHIRAAAARRAAAHAPPAPPGLTRTDSESVDEASALLEAFWI